MYTSLDDGQIKEMCPTYCRPPYPEFIPCSIMRNLVFLNHDEKTQGRKTISK